MSEMMERVARAICIAQGLDPEADSRIADGVMIGIALEDPRNCASYQILRQARAAIEAMREPTERMLVEVDFKLCADGGRDALLMGWVHMVDEAMNDRPAKIYKAKG